MNPTGSESPLPIAVLISGGGRTLRNLIQRADADNLDVDIRLVISSSRAAGGLNHARASSIESLVVAPDECRSPEAFSQAVFEPCRQAGVQLVVMAGFIKHVPIPGDFENRVVNIHPGLIPAFCGHGFYGHRVHSAVLEYGAKMSGCTVHFVDNQYDHGPIILQRTVPVADDDTADTLAERVFELECEAYPDSLQLIAEGRVQVEGRSVKILPPSD